MTYAVHSIHAPATVIDENGNHAIRGFPMPDPLFTADTLEDAEEWRAGKLAERPQ